MKYTQFVFKTEMCSNLIKIKKRTVNNCKSKKYSQNTQKKIQIIYLYTMHIYVLQKKNQNVHYFSNRTYVLKIKLSLIIVLFILCSK